MPWQTFIFFPTVPSIKCFCYSNKLEEDSVLTDLGSEIDLLCDPLYVL